MARCLQGWLHHHRTHLCASFIKRNHLKAFIPRAYSSCSMVSSGLTRFYLSLNRWKEPGNYIQRTFFLKVIIWLKLPNTFSSFHFLHENVEELAGLSLPRVRRDACYSTGLHLLPVRDRVLWLCFFSPCPHLLKCRTYFCQNSRGSQKSTEIRRVAPNYDDV